MRSAPAPDTLFRRMVVLAVCFLSYLTALATTPRYSITPPADAVLFTSRSVALASGTTVASINSAISTVSTAGGGEVTLANGTYQITEPIRMRSGVRLRGASQAGVILRRADAWQPTSETGMIIAGEALSDIVIQDLTIDGTGYIAGLLHGVMLIDNTYGTLRRLRLFNLAVRNCAGGVHIKGSEDVRIADSDISANGGLEAYWHNIYLRRCTRARVTNCTLNDSPTGSGFQSTDSHHTRVDRCTVSGNFWRGIRSAGASTYVLVDGNTVTNNGRYGIGNNFETTTAPSYFCYIDNLVTGNADYGINTNGSSSFGQVVNNVCTGNSPGNYILNGTNIEFADAVSLPPSAPSGFVARPANSRMELSWTGGSPATEIYTVKRSASAAGPFTSIVSELASTSYTDPDLAAGATWFYKVCATNALGPGPDSPTLAATVPTLLTGTIIGTDGSRNSNSATTRTLQQIWRLDHFGTLTDAGPSADAADPDGDGLPNLLEYASDTDPQIANQGSLVSVAITTDSPPRLQIAFDRSPDPALIYSFEASSDLQIWTTIDADPGLPGQFVVVTDPMPEGRRFLRLKISVVR